MQNQISLFKDFSYDVTVVMVSYHTGAALWRAIDSVLAQEGLNELILVDNGNNADTRQRLVKKNMKEPRLKVLSGHGNIGLYQGYNLGAERAKGRYLLFLSPETIIPHDFLLRMVDDYQKDADCWSVSCKILNEYGNTKIESSRKTMTPFNFLSERIGLNRFFKGKAASFYNRGDKQALQYHNCPSAICFLTDINQFKQLNCFDESYFYAYGDVDFANKLSNLGGKALYNPDLTVIDYRTTSSYRSFKARWHALRDSQRYFNKHYKNEYLPGVIFLFNILVVCGWLFKTIASFFTLPFKSRKPKAQKESERCTKFLESYKEFITPEDSIPNGTIYDLSQRTPILFTGAHTDIGLSILRRLLAADLEIVALYEKQIIDFEHPKLTWLHSDLIQYNISSSQQKPRTLIFADDLRNLPELLENFKAIGVNRILALGSAYVFRLLSSGNKKHKAEAKSFVLAEGDISRTSPVLNIDTTIIRADMTYGMGTNDNVSSITRFIRLFGFLPILPPASGKRQPIHCDDVAINAISLINYKETFGRTYNLSGDETLTYCQIIEKIFNAINKKKRILFCKKIIFISKVLSPFISLKTFNKEAILRANEDIVFIKDQLPKHLRLPQRSFLQDGIKSIFPMK